MPEILTHKGITIAVSKLEKRIKFICKCSYVTFKINKNRHMNHKIIINTILITILFSALFIGCKGEDTEEVNEKKIDTLNNNEKAFKFKNTLFSIPSPFHIVSLIKNSKVQYNPDLLNPISNSTKYSSNEKKALNLGVYSADMAYTNIHEQYSSTIKYIKVAKTLSSDLQIMNSNSIDLISKIEDKIKDPDSLNEIFANTYREVDFYLKDNGRNDASVQILTGAWIEGLYLMTQTAKKCKNQSLTNRIGEQKYSIANILKLIYQNNTNSENDFHKKLIKNLNELKELFNKITIEYEYDKHIIFPNEKKTIVISNTKITITQDILNKITAKTKEVRDLIIN